jgi:hypothetical protein
MKMFIQKIQIFPIEISSEIVSIYNVITKL